MRIQSIELCWFRGAADAVALKPDCKSMVVYGANGAGKSCFVDAIEFIVAGGRIAHLAHEYSGKKQERAIRNTHTPAGRQSCIKVCFKDDSRLTVSIDEDGTSTTSRTGEPPIGSWEYRRTVLRQHEVSDFIHSRKGEKYSALLPLLGLTSMEVAAENLRQLAKAVEEVSDVARTKFKLEGIQSERRSLFDQQSDAEIFEQLTLLHSRYCAGKADTATKEGKCADLSAAIAARVAASTADQQMHVALANLGRVELSSHVAAIRTAAAKLVNTVEPLITEKLAVLKSAVAYSAKIKEGDDAISCPACGQPIPADAFASHLAAEQQRLEEIIETFNARNAAISRLCTALAALRAAVQRAEMKSWRDAQVAPEVVEHFEYIDALDIETLRVSCDEMSLQGIELHCVPVAASAAAASRSAPPGAQELAAAGKIVSTIRDILTATQLASEIKRVNGLMSFIRRLEQCVRERIRIRAQDVIQGLSDDIRRMWSMLHPNEPIDEVCLYLPEAADKAIDVRLRFHGVEQDSPRLTLSEGCRNGLGLCIFLAMAKREGVHDRPTVLDDVVVSFDRGHRGMIARVLEQEFRDRQVIILTHDRDWYAELRHQLDDKDWTFRTLLPYEAPVTGIRWSHKASTFDDARAMLATRPDSAGNDARKILDVELAMAAERLQLPMPFVRGDKNDKRMAYDFLQGIVGAAKKCAQKRGADGSYAADGVWSEPLEAAGKLLVTWGNRASHSTDLERNEAINLIDACEAALNAFKCAGCGKHIWFAEAGSQEVIQCSCGGMRWRYGKA
jgi:hypothetical protein